MLNTITKKLITTSVALAAVFCLSAGASYSTEPTKSSPYGKNDTRAQFYDQDADTSSWLPSYKAGTFVYVDPLITSQLSPEVSNMTEIEQRLKEASKKTGLDYYFVWTLLGSKDRDTWEIQGARYTSIYQRNGREICQGKLARLNGIWNSNQTIGYDRSNAVVIMAITSTATNGTLIDVDFGDRATSYGLKSDLLNINSGILPQVRRLDCSVPSKAAVLAEDIAVNLPEFQARKAAKDKADALGQQNFWSYVVVCLVIGIPSIVVINILHSITNGIQSSRQAKSDAERAITLANERLHKAEESFKYIFGQLLVGRYKKDPDSVSPQQKQAIEEALADLEQSRLFHAIASSLRDAAVASIKSLKKPSASDYSKIAQSLKTEDISLRTLPLPFQKVALSGDTKQRDKVRANQVFNSMEAYYEKAKSAIAMADDSAEMQ